ncbi:MAG: cysteine-rich CWC family protein [Burkholderiales bacterium]|nr:cysteine-rich CWC family protein [Burkholderiales bacterium]
MCPVCGAAFECGMAAGAPACWCAGLPPVPPVPGEGCLCPRCLAARAAS